MPIYEYRCNDCAEVTTLFLRAIGDPITPLCGQCQSGDMVRRVSSFAMGKSSGAPRRGDTSGGPLDYYRDPRNIGRNVEESFSRHGVDMPDTVRKTIDAARDGQVPKGLDI